jgi:hypothetical protein
MVTNGKSPKLFGPYLYARLKEGGRFLIPTGLIEPNPDNPWKHMGEPALNELVST